MVEGTGRSIGRVVVELGAAGPASVLIDVAAELAEALNARIAAQFVEDEMLLELADLPTAVTLSVGGRRGRLDRERVAEAIALQASACRRAFAARAKQGRLQWTFEVMRGHAVATSVEIMPSDIVALSDSSGGLTLSSAFASVRSLVEAAAAVLLVPERGRNLRGPVAVVSEHTTDNTMEFAAGLAARMGEELSVLRVVDESRSLMETDPRFRPRSLFGVGRLADDLMTKLRALAPRLVVTDFPGGVFDDAGGVSALMRAARSPLLILQPRSGG